MATLPAATDYTDSSVTQGGKKTFMAAFRAFVAACLGTDSASIDFSANSLTATYGTIGPSLTAGGFNIAASYSYNDNSSHALAAIPSKFAIIYIRQATPGNIAIPFFARGGGGVDYRFTALSPDAGTWAEAAGYSQTVTMPGTGGNTYSLSVASGSGVPTIQRTSGSGAYNVYIQSLGE